MKRGQVIADESFHNGGVLTHCFKKPKLTHIRWLIITQKTLHLNWTADYYNGIMLWNVNGTQEDAVFRSWLLHLYKNNPDSKLEKIRHFGCFFVGKETTRLALSLFPWLYTFGSVDFMGDYYPKNIRRIYTFEKMQAKTEIINSRPIIEYAMVRPTFLGITIMDSYPQYMKQCKENRKTLNQMHSALVLFWMYTQCFLPRDIRRMICFDWVSWKDWGTKKQLK